ncbi:ATP-dependent DNA helicase [Corallococcus exercitus]|uniref:ATP-dependent DNA helicase n=1 Tax=Corallococcus exercitus TaxID=2316736 RepID=UPI0035D407C0
MNDYLSEVFGDGGLFASRFPGYEMREGQVALARMVDEAMRGGRHTLGEGPCGTGKSVAYSVPAVWHAHHDKKRVVIATANIALQEQLVRKDLPMLASVLPWPFTFALLKGRNNYLCLDRMAESEARGELRGLYYDDQQRQVDDVLAWAEATKTGDVSELAFIPQAQVWSRFSVGSEECKGDGCPFRGDCFAERAKATAQGADIIVTNYHMLFAHLAVREATGQDLVLPAFDLLVLDEAHEAAEIAREFFGFTVSEHTLGRLASAAADLGNKQLAGELRQEAQRLFATLADYARSPRYKKRLKAPGFASDAGLQRSLGKLVALATARAEDELAEKKERATARNVAKNAIIAGARLAEGLSQTDAGKKVYWLEVDSKGRAKLRAKPIDVSDLLREELFARCPSVSLVSATLTTSGTFDFVRRELGVPEGALEVIAETPFDFQSQALLVVPEKLPDPRDADFIDAAAHVFQQVVEACDGRTLGLFTSYRNLNAVYERIDGGRHRVLRQGDLPRAELTRLFKEDTGSILLGTESFWTGIDVAGEALTGLVIDKLPFPPPDDPVIDAICERDPRAFDNYLVPLAIIALRQGVGRLIRCKTDVGVAVILDKRIAEKGYGRKFLKSLPPMLTTRRVENISRFLEEAADAHAS